jgi:hypothetical protein
MNVEIGIGSDEKKEEMGKWEEKKRESQREVKNKLQRIQQGKVYLESKI